MFWRRWLAGVTTVAAVTAALVVGSPPAGAAGTTTVPIPVGLSGSTTSSPLAVGAGLVIPLPPELNGPLSAIATVIPDWGPGQYGVGLSASTVKVKAEFAQAASVDAAFTDSSLTEGKTLDVSDTVRPLTGTVKATAVVHGDIGLFKNGFSPSDWDPKWTDTFDKNIDMGTVLCTVPAPGEAPKVCDIGQADFDLIGLDIVPFVLGFELSFVLDMQLEIDSTGMVTTREFHVLPKGSDIDGLSFPTPTIADPYDLACNAGGNDLTATLTDTALSVDPTIPTTLKYVVQFVGFPNTPGEDTLEEWVLAQRSLGDLDFAPASLQDNGPNEVTLGTVGLDTTAPTLTVAPSFSGSEGSPITFAANVEDACLAGDIMWSFSDGSSEFGPLVQKKFADDGPYTGKVVATDVRGNKTTKNFTVSVSNVAPNANAGPDDTSPWGVSVAFNGSAVDPSSADQANLHYSWDFGDGTPSANGGPNVTHTYSVAGDYTATLSVCDDDGACDSTPDTRVVHVTKRSTSVSYSGATYGLPKKTVAVSASVIDQLGQPVPGRIVKFTMGADTVSATTGANGVAVASLKINGKQGSYTMAAALMLPAGENRYVASSESVPFTIGK